MSRLLKYETGACRTRIEVGLCFSQLPVGLDLWANRLADVPASTHTHAINLCEAYYRRARGQLRTRDPPSCSCPERSNLHLRRAQKCVSGGSTGPCSAGWWPRTVRLGEVMVHARVLLRLRGRKERDHHEQGSIQHRVGLVRGSCETPRGGRAITANVIAVAKLPASSTRCNTLSMFIYMVVRRRGLRRTVYKLLTHMALQVWRAGATPSCSPHGKARP